MQGQREVREQGNITLRFSRLVSSLTLRHYESLHGDTPGHNIKHLRERERERDRDRDRDPTANQGRDTGECKENQDKKPGPGWHRAGACQPGGPGQGWTWTWTFGEWKSNSK